MDEEKFSPKLEGGEGGDDSIFRYCRDQKVYFSEFPPEAWEAFPEFFRIVKHFSLEAGSVVREIMDTRSPMEIEILNGIAEEDMKIIEGFFGLPVKPPGRLLDFKLTQDPVIRHLGGAYEEQTVFIKEISKGFRFFAALWPWRTRPGMITLHLGIHDPKGGWEMNERFKNFLHGVLGES